ncbi:espin-like [Littorina saxatilis]
MIEQKNKEKIEAFIKQKKKDKENEAKWRNVPEWKRALMMKKDQEDQEAAELAKSSPQKASKSKAAPPADKPEPMPKPKGDYVPAALSIDPEELASMPPWKRELLFKRDKVPITFSNEFNPDEEEDGQQQNDEQS